MIRGIAKGGMRLIVEMPPRHGKTEYCARWLPVWLLEGRPWWRVILASYTASLAVDSGRKVRDTIEAHQDELSVRLKQDSRAKGRWNTHQGGGMLCAGVGGSIIGFGGNVLVLDDPLKNAQEAMSELKREGQVEWWDSTFRTRLEPDGSIILLLQRWHPFDLSGHLQAKAKENPDADQWEVVSYPALCELPEPEHDEDGTELEWPDGVPPGWSRVDPVDDEDDGLRDPLGRRVGDALWPGRYSREALLQHKASAANAIYFDGQYQQRPKIRSGGMFQKRFFRIVDRAPVAAAHCRRFRFWDMAATEAEKGKKAGAKDPCWTVGVLGFLFAGDLYIEHVERFRGGPAEVERRIKATCARDVERYGHGVRTFIEREGGASGKIVANDYVTRVLRGYAVRMRSPTGSKIERAEPVSAYAETGHVVLVEGRWVSKYIEEHVEFPRGKHKDQVDATSGLFLEVVGQTTTPLA